MAVLNNRARKGGEAGEEPALADRPRTRADCVDGERPCPWVGCRYHLWADVMPSGSLKIAHDVDPLDLTESCALDVCAQGSHTLDQVAGRLNVTRERLRQIEEAAIAKLAAAGVSIEELLKC
jgi:hypothetical protein